ncbi:hypothetical protein DPMN_134345 [Dreissena polymorpha]|uniref:Elongation factor EFG domain-containing protein n=1 Tax=Dreissena polymorpha TaxID=45954 RepID=A0A9D4FW00_DREPO|nr:hypothetical protein DPMN_134345 [Dreissena polymorpha]
MGGANHPVDSSDRAFEQCTHGAMKQVYEKGQWQVLEPVMSVEINLPVEFQAPVQNNLNKRNAIILGTDSNEGYTTIYCEVPLNDMFGYSNELRSMTQGKGEFTMEYNKYCPVLPGTMQILMEEYQKQVEEDRKLKQKKKN